jgi:hypothetical protein
MVGSGHFLVIARGANARAGLVFHGGTTQESHMRLAFVGLLTAAAALMVDVQPSVAQFNSRYCTIGTSRDSSGMPHCAYHTWQQCMASASGMGQYCTENPNWRGPRQGPTTQGRSRRQRDY